MAYAHCLITGGCVALHDAIQHLIKTGKITTNPFKQFVASVSVGIYQGVPIVDLDYVEDSSADTDMNVVMTEHGKFIEIQGTVEKDTFEQTELEQMLAIAKEGIRQLVEKQKTIVR